MVTTPVKPNNTPKRIWQMIFSSSPGSVLIGTSPIISTLPSSTNLSISFLAFGVATLTSSLGSTSSLPKVITSSQQFTTTF